MNWKFENCEIFSLCFVEDVPHCKLVIMFQSIKAINICLTNSTYQKMIKCSICQLWDISAHFYHSSRMHTSQESLFIFQTAFEYHLNLWLHCPPHLICNSSVLPSVWKHSFLIAIASKLRAFSLCRSRLYPRAWFRIFDFVHFKILHSTPDDSLKQRIEWL